MKSKAIALSVILSVLCLFMCAFTVDDGGSVKSLTKPYITTYECTAARLGNEDLMQKYDYIKITFLDDKELEVSMKRKHGKRSAYRCGYEYDDKTGKFKAELGILGFRFRQDCKIENGKFTVCMPILGRTLLMNFKA